MSAKYTESIRAVRRRLKVVLTRWEEVRDLPRDEAVRKLRQLRDVWEALTTRTCDLPDERLEDDGIRDIRRHLKWYTSDEARSVLAPYLVDAVLALSRD